MCTTGERACQEENSTGESEISEVYIDGGLQIIFYELKMIDV